MPHGSQKTCICSKCFRSQHRRLNPREKGCPRSRRQARRRGSSRRLRRPSPAPTIAAPAPAKTEAGRDRSTIVALIAKLHEADADTARDAAVTLGTLPTDAEAVTALCAAVRNADNYFHPVVRAAAATTLGKLKDPRAVDALIHATGDSMAEASEEAVKALGLLGDRRAISALERIVKNEQHFYLDPVRRTAEEALHRIRG